MPKNALGLLADPRGEMRATPRNRLMGLLADALQGAQDYAQRPDPRMPGGKANPVLGLLADGLGLNSAAITANRASYGEPLTNAGKANVPWLKPETADVAMMAPLSPRNALAALGGGFADDATMRAMMLFHGSNVPGKLVIDAKPRPGNVFDGVFASPSKAAARSHGDYLHALDVPDSSIMQRGAPSLPQQDIDAALKQVAGKAYSPKTRADLWAAVVDDDASAAQRLVGVLGDDAGAASWEAQRLRGALADRLGYKAAAMGDEHGTSYLVRPGVEAQLIESPEPVQAMSRAAAAPRQYITMSQWRALSEGDKAARAADVSSVTRRDLQELARYGR